MPGKNMLSVAYKKLHDCLSFVEHPVLRTVLLVVLVVFNAGLLPMVNMEVAKVLRLGVVRLLVVVVIALFSMRDPVLGILLAMALVTSTMHCGMEGMTNQEEEQKGQNPSLGRAMEVNMDAMPSASPGANSPMNMGRPMEDAMIESMTNKAEMEHKQDEAHQEEQKKQMENFDNMNMNNSVQGFNVNPDCMNGNNSLQCTPVQTWEGSINTQGLGQVEGASNTNVGSPW